MAFTEAAEVPGSPAFDLGMDVMQVKLPRNADLNEFVDSISDALTPLERRSLLSGSRPTAVSTSLQSVRSPATLDFSPPPPQPLASIPPHVALDRLYILWTLKEAYTKALGLGLGFDFSRIEFAFDSEPARPDTEGGGMLRVDGAEPPGWEFVVFQLPAKEGDESSAGTDHYRGVVALHIDGAISRFAWLSASQAQQSFVVFKRVRDIIELLEST